MSELTLTLIRLLFLAGLWILVLSIVGVLRSDLYGTRIRRTSDTPRRTARRRKDTPAGHATTAAAPAAVGAPTAGMAAAARATGGHLPAQAPAHTPPGGVLPGTEKRSRGGLFGRGRSSSSDAPSRLVVTEGRMAGTTIPLKGSPLVIGRSPECTLVLDDDYASGRHARLSPSGTGWTVEDLGSTNGTLLDGHKLTGPAQLRVGSALRIGQTVIELQA